MLIKDKIYCEGEKNIGGDCEYTVCCYDPSQDEWTTLPASLPVKSFGLGEVNGKLVAVGGEKSNNRNIISAEVHTYENEKWELTEIPPMPTARSLPSVLSLQSALVVAGGARCDQTGRLFVQVSYFWPREVEKYFCAVEIFKPDTSQWYRTDPLPTACSDISLISTGNTCYALGGYNGLFLNRALYASADDLLGNAVPADQTTSRRSSSDTQLAWKTLPNTRTKGPAAAVLAGNLLAVGGDETKEIYLYTCQTESWAYIGSLPCDSKGFGSVISLSSLEILVIANGGKSVYKGTPSIFKSH